MSKKTAMQELIEWTESKTQLFTPSRGQIIQKANELLEKEKQQIVDACKEFGNLNGVGQSDYEQYYNETYGSDDKE